MYAAEVNRHVPQEAKRRRELVENLLARHSVTGYQLHLLKGDASIVIPLLVTKLGIEVPVMGTVVGPVFWDSSLAIRLSGCWTQSIVCWAQCSVEGAVQLGRAVPIVSENPERVTRSVGGVS